jgi:hypothetical protein
LYKGNLFLACGTIVLSERAGQLTHKFSNLSGAMANTKNLWI